MKYGSEKKDKEFNSILNGRPLYEKSRERTNRSLGRSPLVSLLFPTKFDQTKEMLKYSIINCSRQREQQKYYKENKSCFVVIPKPHHKRNIRGSIA